MIRLNLATKPGLQSSEIREPEIAPSVLETERSTVSASNEFEPLPEDLLREGEKQLEELEQKEEEFIPRHVSLPPQKERLTEEKVKTSEDLERERSEEERVAQLLKKKSRRTLWVVAILIILCLLGAGGYLTYESYRGGAWQVPAITSLMTKIRIERESLPKEAAEASTEVSTEVQAFPTLSYEDTRQALMSAYYLQKFAQLISWFPSETRLNRAKLNFNRVYFVAYINDNKAINTLKNAILTSGDYETPEVFQVDSLTAEKHILAVIQIKPPSLPDSVICEALNDTLINTKVWNLGKQYQLDIQPLVLYAAPLTEPHRAEVTAQGTISSCGQFLYNLAAAKLNWRLETVLLKTASLDQTPSNNVNLIISSIVLLPQ